MDETEIRALIEQMENVLAHLKKLINKKLRIDELINKNDAEKEEAHYETGRLLSLYFSLNYKYMRKIGKEINPDTDELCNCLNNNMQKIDSQSKLDMIESLAKIFLEYGNKAKTHEYVKESIYTLFKEMYSDIIVGTKKLKIFSFRKFSDWSKEDIRENKLTLSNPKKFNDPFDTLLPYWLDYTLQKLNKGSNVYQIQKWKQEMCKCIKVRSFILSKDDAVENLPQLMWAHYADEHKGFCIKYEFDKEFFSADDERKSALVWQKIKYVHDDSQYNDGIRLSEALLTKSDIWSYENELRLLMFDPSREDDYVSVPLNGHARITDIYLGERCSDEDMNFMKYVVMGKGICLHKMKKNNYCAFKLDCEPV